MKQAHAFSRIRLMMTLTLLLLVAGAWAQTARKFTLNLTDDGKAQMVCFCLRHRRVRL